MSDIFISYARKDRNRAKPLAEALESQGWTVWWDPKIPPGRTFADVIDEEISIAECILALWSKVSIKKNWVLEEAQDGLERGILVPVLIEDVNPPRGFRRIQAANLIEWDGSEGSPRFKKLVSSIRDTLGTLPVQTELERQAEAERGRVEEEGRRKEAELKRKEKAEEERKRKEQTRLEEKKRRQEEEAKREAEEQRQQFKAAEEALKQEKIKLADLKHQREALQKRREVEEQRFLEFQRKKEKEHQKAEETRLREEDSKRKVEQEAKRNRTDARKKQEDRTRLREKSTASEVCKREMDKSDVVSP